MTQKEIWLDIETTGKNYYTDSILQIAVVITDGDRNPIEEYEWVIKHDKETVMAKADDGVKEMHEKTNLWNRLEPEGLPFEQVDKELREVFNTVYDGKWKVKLSGSSVHFDMNFIAIQMPEAGAIVSHQVCDVSSILEGMRRTQRKVNTKKGHITTHNAIDDIKHSIYLFNCFEQKLAELENTI